MTTPAALRELVDRFKDAIDTNMMDGTARRTLHKLVDELRTAASEGMAKPFAHLVMTEWNSIAWWTTESAERAQKEADELMRYDSMRKLTVVTVYTHPPEVARDAGRWMPIESAPKYKKVLVWREDSGVFVAELTTPENVIPESQLEEMEFPDDFEEWWSDAYGWQEGSERPTHWQHFPYGPQAAISGAAGVG